MKITPDHLARGAFIYVRQSTVDQLANNHESRLRQYGLADRARALGWTDVTVIDDDLGRSGSGVNAFAVSIVGDQPLIPFIVWPRQITLVMVDEQDRPV